MAGKRALIIDTKDNVAPALADIDAGEKIGAVLGKEATTLEAKEKIPFGFKVALADIPKDGVVIKYGDAIGKASARIKRGQLVHVNNVEGTRGRGDLTKEATKKQPS